jgi:hypothetical protein
MEFAAFEDAAQGMRCAAKHLMAAKFQTQVPRWSQPGLHRHHNV